MNLISLRLSITDRNMLEKMKQNKWKVVWRSWHRASWYISTVKPTSCTIFKFIEYHSTCFGRSFRPSSGVQDCTYIIRYMSYRFVDCMLPVTRWNCSFVSWPLDRPKHVEWDSINSKNCASSWIYYRSVVCICRFAKTVFIRGVRIFAKKGLLASSCLSVCLSVRIKQRASQ